MRPRCGIDFVNDFRGAIASQPDAVAIHPWPDGFQMSAVLTHDVETNPGFAMVDKLVALEEQFGCGPETQS